MRLQARADCPCHNDQSAAAGPASVNSPASTPASRPDSLAARSGRFYHGFIEARGASRAVAVMLRAAESSSEPLTACSRTCGRVAARCRWRARAGHRRDGAGSWVPSGPPVRPPAGRIRRARHAVCPMHAPSAVPAEPSARTQVQGRDAGPTPGGRPNLRVSKSPHLTGASPSHSGPLRRDCARRGW